MNLNITMGQYYPVDSFVHRLPSHIIPCGHTVLFSLIQSIGFLFSAWVFNNRQSVLPAKLIGALTEQPQVGFIIVVVLPVQKGNRVYNKVVMQALGI